MPKDLQGMLVLLLSTFLSTLAAHFLFWVLIHHTLLSHLEAKAKKRIPYKRDLKLLKKVILGTYTYRRFFFFFFFCTLML